MDYIFVLSDWIHCCLTQIYNPLALAEATLTAIISPHPHLALPLLRLLTVFQVYHKHPPLFDL